MQILLYMVTQLKEWDSSVGIGLQRLSPTQLPDLFKGNEKLKHVIESIV